VLFFIFEKAFFSCTARLFASKKGRAGDQQPFSPHVTPIVKAWQLNLQHVQKRPIRKIGGKIVRALQDVSGAIKAQAASIGEGAREKSNQVIEEWLQIFTRLEQFHLKMNSFSVALGFSPGLEAELQGTHADFTPERLDKILKACKGSPGLLSVFTTVKTTYALHAKAKLPLVEPLIIRIRVRLTPEISVFIGKPLIE
jgi:hypothetical protein